MAETLPGLEATYRYCDPASRQPQLIVFRLRVAGGGKRFLQARPEGEGYVLKAPPPPLPLYNRSRIAGAERVVVVEGEKAIHALHGVGIAATTSPGGAGKAGYADWQPLAGKSCILWPDHDPPGIAHMQDVAQILQQRQPPAQASWSDPALLRLDAKGDATDFIEALTDASPEAKRAAVEQVVASAVPLGPGRELAELVEATVSGGRRSLDWPWRLLGRLTRVMPGTVALLCGEGGVSKSFLVLQAAAWWHELGRRVALYELEGTRAEHLQRALAQRAGSSALTDDNWL